MSTARGRVLALDPRSGEVQWAFDPGSREDVEALSHAAADEEPDDAPDDEPYEEVDPFDVWN